MKLKDPLHKKRVWDRLRRIEWQIRGVIQMIEDEASVTEVIQQLSAVRSAMGQAVNEEIICAVEKITDKKSSLEQKDYDEIRDLMKVAR
jgi:CsoR family transcriptional regulator, copper-sensing transcriptional repressor